MKLFINNTLLPYMGGCVIERNYAFFSIEGIENSFSYSHKVPINAESTKLFGNINRLRVPVSTDLYDHRFIDQLGSQFTGKSRINKTDDDFFYLNIEDTASSIWARLKTLNLNELDLDEYTFNSIDDYSTWAKSGTDDFYTGKNLSYPLLHAKDFFSDLESAAGMDLWNDFPVFNHWHDLRTFVSPQKPATMLWPCIRVSHIVAAIESKLGISNFFLKGLGEWYIPSHYNVPIDDLFEEKKAYSESQGVISLKVVDFMPKINALEFITRLLNESNSISWGDDFGMNFNSRAEIISDETKPFDITPYVIGSSQTTQKSINGYKYLYYGRRIINGAEELEIEISEDPINIAVYYKDAGKTHIGSVDIVYQTTNYAENWFPHFACLSPAKRVTTSTTYLDDYNTLYQFPFEDLSEDMETYLDWKIKHKRIITAKCIPHKLLFNALNSNRVLFNDTVCLLKQARWEILPHKSGLVKLVMVQR